MIALVVKNVSPVVFASLSAMPTLTVKTEPSAETAIASVDANPTMTANLKKSALKKAEFAKIPALTQTAEPTLNAKSPPTELFASANLDSKETPPTHQPVVSRPSVTSTETVKTINPASKVNASTLAPSESVARTLNVESETINPSVSAHLDISAILSKNVKSTSMTVCLELAVPTPDASILSEPSTVNASPDVSEIPGLVVNAHRRIHAAKPFVEEEPNAKLDPEELPSASALPTCPKEIPLSNVELKVSL